MIQQQPGGQQQLLMLQPTQVMSGPPTPSTPTQPGPVYGSPQRASPPGTTSDDSDDSVPSHHSQVNTALKRLTNCFISISSFGIKFNHKFNHPYKLVLSFIVSYQTII